MNGKWREGGKEGESNYYSFDNITNFFFGEYTEQHFINQ